LLRPCKRHVGGTQLLHPHLGGTALIVLDPYRTYRAGPVAFAWALVYARKVLLV
jgi:hypothetical protein